MDLILAAMFCKEWILAALFCKEWILAAVFCKEWMEDVFFKSLLLFLGLLSVPLCLVFSDGQY